MEHRQRPVLALLLRTACALSFSTLALLVILAGQSGVALPEIMFWRQFLAVPMVLAYLALTSGLGRLKTSHLGKHAARSTVGILGMACNFTAVLLLPLAESTTLGFTAPLFVVIIAALVLREHVGVWRWSAVAMGLAGVIIIAQPGGAPIPLLGGLAALGWALATAVVSFLIRGMASTEEPLRIVFYFSLFGTVIVAPMLPFYVTAHDSRQWLLLGGIGILGMLGQLFMTSSLRLGAVASVVVMDYTSLIWATVLGWLVWGYLPSSATWLGAPLIVAAGIVIAWREHWLAKEVSAVLASPAST